MGSIRLITDHLDPTLIRAIRGRLLSPRFVFIRPSRRLVAPEPGAEAEASGGGPARRSLGRGGWLK